MLNNSTYRRHRADNDINLNKFYLSSEYLPTNKNDNFIHTSTNKRPIIVIIPEMFYGNPAPCTYIRIFTPLLAPPFTDTFELRVATLQSVLLISADAIIINRVPCEHVSGLDNFLAHVRQTGAKIIYDIDDQLLDIADTHPEATVYSARKAVVRTLLSAADAVWVSTIPLAEAFRSLCKKIEVFENYLDINLWKKKEESLYQSNNGKKFNILYMGTTTHAADLDIVLDALHKLHLEGAYFELYLIGITTDLPKYSWIKVIQPPESAGNNNYPEFMRWLRSLDIFDLGIAPLEETSFNRCKSAIKYWDYTSLGIPTLASDVEAYNTIIADGRTGLLAKNITNIWYNQLRSAIYGRTHLAKIAKNAELSLTQLYTKINGSKARTHATLQLLKEPEQAMLVKPPRILPLKDIDPGNARFPQDVAVHAHVFYPELALELRHYLESIPIPFHLYVTTDTTDKATNIEASLSGMLNARSVDIRVVTNRGRDIAPMLVELGENLSHHEIVLHIHTKKSPHNSDLRGWRRYLMQSLLGNSQLVTAILNYFARDEHLGILYPQAYHPVIPFMRLGGNAAGIQEILKKSGREAEEIERVDMTSFPAGFMFWFRGRVLAPFIRMKLTIEDFEAEAGQDDSTLAHAIERIFPYLAFINGFRSQAFLPFRLLDTKHPGAVPISELLPLLSTSSCGICIIFDHKRNGELHRHCFDLINKTMTNEFTVLYIYSLNDAWFVEWIAADDGMIFVASDIDILFEALAPIAPETITVNSTCYFYSEADQLFDRIKAFASSLALPVDFKPCEKNELSPNTLKA